jgi:hypothetical protein
MLDSMQTLREVSAGLILASPFVFFAALLAGPCDTGIYLRQAVLLIGVVAVVLQVVARKKKLPISKR